MYPPHPLASSTPPHPTHPLPQRGWTPIYAAAANGHTDAVKELIAAGCDMNLAEKVKQMTGLALALACLGFRVRLPLPPLADLNLQYLFRLLLESLTYPLLFVLL
jgi:ankyrin repeat protein